MTLLLKQSTSVVVSFGPFVDKTDGVTLETGLVSSLDNGTTGIKLSKNGGALTIRHATVTATTYDAYGCYRITLDTTDTNTLGTLRMAFEEAATCLPVWQDFMVVTANVWDSLHSTDVLDTSVVQLLGTAWLTPGTAGTPDVNVKLISGDTAAADNAEAFFDGTGYAGTNNVIPLVTTTTTATNLTNAPTNGDLTATMKTSVTTAATAATPTAAAVTGAVGSVTGNVGGNVVGSVGSVTGAVGSVTGNVGGNVVGSVASVTAGVTVTTNNDKTGYALSGAGVQAIWDALTSGLITAGSIGKLLVDNINATISSRSTYAGADTAGTTTLLSRIVGTLASGTHNAQGGDAYARLGAPAWASVSADIAAAKTDTAAIKAKTDNLPASPAATTDIPTAAVIADAVHDEAVEGSTTMRQLLRLYASVLLNKASGGATTTITYRDLADTKARVTLTVDANGNRSAVSLDGS